MRIFILKLSHVQLCHFVKIVKHHPYVSSYQWLGNVDMHMYAKCDQNIPCGSRDEHF